MFTINTQIIYKLPDFIPNLNIDLSFPQILTPKYRPPPLKKHPVLDSPDEIKKWLEQRRKRYPNKQKPTVDENAQELSILEIKLRKKILILSGSSRRTQIKAKQMKELCKVLTESKRIQKKMNIIEPQISSDSEENDKEEKDQKIDDKEAISKEITKLQKKLSNNRPREYYKQVKEAGEQQQLSKMEKQIIKTKIKDLKVKLKQLNPEPEQVKEYQNVIRQENTQTLEDHTKEMIDNLEEQKEKIENLLEESLNYRVNPANFRYKSNTLYTNMLIGEIFRERQYVLQAIRQLVKENFFEVKEQGGLECITSESDEEEQESSEEEKGFQEEMEEYF
ncbi:unnamed protein product (macronuclear) [Paramecium tetraurelia]|uniref:FMR1-interacting protein 1 conserved domain-containing protein n=1 Tax=Paramecium tetraurelia TaxID=5888 RepID=A0C831_PARTE|nr:uncharacterized protein GSPATT00036079001 [Paramecium tetraurelia]CAK66948.1 unnamed protein product [Paramecium tetraurelia]|eukprot:XP_001434345.1 hypothetical protein (macronuclear) [Paramecium tetraurelia strain d4-2]